MLEETDSDVLLLYDCCNSASISTSGSGPGKGGVKEVIAACGFEAIAPEVGEHSFTEALIHTLKVLSRNEPFSVAQLHAQTLSRLRCWSPELETRPNGEYVYERQPRRTPIYSILSETIPRRSIVLAPLLAPPNTCLETLISAQAVSTSSAPLMDRCEIPKERLEESGKDIKCAQILLAIRVKKTDLDKEQWAEWIRNVPGDGVDIHIEGRWNSFSTLLLVRMPIAVWNLLPEHPAYSFVGFVTSERLAVDEKPSSGAMRSFPEFDMVDPIPIPTSDQTSDIFAQGLSHDLESDSSAGFSDLDGIDTFVLETKIASSPQFPPNPKSSGRAHQEDEEESQPFGVLNGNMKNMFNIIKRLGNRWNDTEAVIWRKKVLFICGVLNILITGYLLGGHPEIFHYWYTAQLFYLMPIRYYTYYNRGWGYFLVDLCYFVNFLCLCTIWVWPHSKNLFIATYCLAFGNNAFGIALWGNLLVFHNLEKTTTLFIHIMPCVALHCLVHLLPQDFQQERFPAIWAIKTLTSGSRTYDSLWTIIVRSTVTYAIWQTSYYFMITVRHREQIAQGRLTSFIWLKNSYSKAYGVGEYIRWLPESFQEPTFMVIQYCYVVLTAVPCLFWFWYRYASGGFLLVVFCWSMYNSATFYIEVFGKRNRDGSEEGQRWQGSKDKLKSLWTTASSDRRVRCHG